jgi:hypothetical protein
MPKVKVTSTFIGSPKELEEYGGQVPEHLKKIEDKMTKEEKASFRGVITQGTVMEVSDKRAEELEKLGVVGEAKAEKAKADLAAAEAKAKPASAKTATKASTKKGK